MDCQRKQRVQTTTAYKANKGTRASDVHVGRDIGKEPSIALRLRAQTPRKRYSRTFLIWIMAQKNTVLRLLPTYLAKEIFDAIEQRETWKNRVFLRY
jgi:hypothetical protein